MYDTQPYDSSLHLPGTAAARGACSWHGPVSCSETPIISFRDAHGWWHSACPRAVDELTARGHITGPTPAQD
jgi:hypothetical protein